MNLVSNNIKYITDESELYPDLLREITKPPHELYVRGNINILHSNHLLAVVGTRKASAYGQQAVAKLLTPVVQNGIGLVSGLAYGIDSLAHNLAVINNQMTIAVLGSGIDDASIYPKSHIALVHRIIATGGAVISEYAPGTPAMPHHFPARNRIIAGLCQAVLIVQAAKRSGSLITARLALDFNRDVCVVPGPINDPLSAGTNKLLQQGAKPIIEAYDLFDVLGIDVPETKNKLVALDLSPKQKDVLKSLSYEPQHADELMRVTGLASSDLSVVLTELELLDLAHHVGGLKFVLTGE